VNPPLVAILIPCHNAAPWLAQTLESARAQTWAHKEIIVVDDGSTDDSARIAHTYAGHAVRLVRQENRGAAAARNHGLSLAQGQFIQFLDADDLLTPDKIATQVELLQRAGHDCVATCRWGRFTDDPAATAFIDDAVFRDFAPIDYLLEHTGAARMMHPAAWLVPRTIADRAGPWDESLSLNHDGEYFARIALAARRIVFASTGASLYRSSLRGSLSRRRDRQALESVARSMKLIATRLSQAEDSPRVRRALADYWQRLIFEIYPAAPDLCRSAEAEVLALGGSPLRPEMGAREQLVAGLFGWKVARRMRRIFSS
jgi:glycosyltransferase involved in cell wall biosynthesis